MHQSISFLSKRRIKLIIVTILIVSALVYWAHDLVSSTPSLNEFTLPRSQSVNALTKLGRLPCSSSPQGEIPAKKFYCSQLIDNAGVASVHAATLANLPDGGVGAWWYGGTREGAKDVAIYFARFDPKVGKFTPPKAVITRQQLSADLGRYIKKIGNPAAILDRNGRLWLFFVSVSVGGWAGSAINFVFSDDGGETWVRAAERLTLSPFFNVSTLVRGSPLEFVSGHFILPIYHEFIGKFSEVLVLSDKGEVIDKRRIPSSNNASQPSMAPLTSERAVLAMRSKALSQPWVHFSSTEDGGRTFTPVTTMNLPNRDNSVATIRLTDEDFLIVYNDDESGRKVLSMAHAARDGSVIKKLIDLENAKGEIGQHEFSYPTVILDQQGLFHVAWTWQRKQIKHAIFSKEWLLSQPSATSETGALEDQDALRPIDEVESQIKAVETP